MRVAHLRCQHLDGGYGLEMSRGFFKRFEVTLSVSGLVGEHGSESVVLAGRGLFGCHQMLGCSEVDDYGWDHREWCAQMMDTVYSIIYFKLKRLKLHTVFFNLTNFYHFHWFLLAPWILPYVSWCEGISQSVLFPGLAYFISGSELIKAVSWTWWSNRIDTYS